MNTPTLPHLNRLVAAGCQSLLKDGLKGLEKESLRITPQGRISQTPHPVGLGAALKHPFITTDYSEALIELITPPFANPADTLDYLDRLHRFVYQHLGDEVLWAASMPCAIEGEHSIPIADYGESNIGKMKHVYRRGLAWRYGRAMQSIAGIHFNYSVNEALWPVLQALLGDTQNPTDFIAQHYFGLTRNVIRHGWLVLYLFGASPAFCQSFFAGRETLAARFPRFDAATLHQADATSLRMSDIGYRNDSQSGVNICFNTLDSYVNCLSKAMTTPLPAYQAIGVKVDGEYRQLNANILQIANEYYSPVRPKQVAHSCESPTLALKRRGVRYIELRSLDLNPALALGLGEQHLRALELFLLVCLLRDSQPFAAGEIAEAKDNALIVASRGREPGLHLQRQAQAVSLRDWARELAESMLAVAEVLDAGASHPHYRASVLPLLAAIDEPALTPSAQILAAMREQGASFQDYTFKLSQQHGADFRARPPSAAETAEFRHHADESWAAQRQTEASDRMNFDAFLAHYFSQCSGLAGTA